MTPRQLVDILFAVHKELGNFILPASMLPKEIPSYYAHVIDQARLLGDNNHFAYALSCGNWYPYCSHNYIANGYPNGYLASRGINKWRISQGSVMGDTVHAVLLALKGDVLRIKLDNGGNFSRGVKVQRAFNKHKALATNPFLRDVYTEQVKNMIARKENRWVSPLVRRYTCSKTIRDTYLRYHYDRLPEEFALAERNPEVWGQRKWYLQGKHVFAITNPEEYSNIFRD